LLLLSAASHIAVLAHDGKELLLADENPAVAAAMLVVTLFPLLLLLTRVVPHACQDYVIASCVEVRTRQHNRNEGEKPPSRPVWLRCNFFEQKKTASCKEFKHNTKETLKLLPALRVLLFCSGLFSALSVVVLVRS